MYFHSIKLHIASTHFMLFLSLTMIFFPRVVSGQFQFNYNNQQQQQNINKQIGNFIPSYQQPQQQQQNQQEQQKEVQVQTFLGQAFDQLENGDNLQEEEEEVSNNRTTISGAQCLLPFVYRGQVWDDCFIVEGKQMCVVENNGLQECAPVKKIEKVDKQKQIVRMTMGGQKCEFPFEYDSKLQYDCVTVVGSEMCVSNGTLQECKPHKLRVQRNTLDGRTCLFPFTLLGKQYHDCTQINGVQACMVDGGLSECAPPSTQNALSAKQIISRSTVDGRQCRFPYSFMDTQYYDCTQFMGEEWCLLDAQWAKCMHSTSSISNSIVDGTSAVLPQIYNTHQDFTSVTEAISNMEDLATLLQSFYLTSLIPLISDKNLQVTVFAPTNAAFESFLRSQSIHVEDLINHPDLLYQILMYHIVPLTFSTHHLQSDQVLTTLLEGYPLTVRTIDDHTQLVAILSQANIVTSNIKAGQAIVHSIDKVLVPFNISLREDIFTKELITNDTETINQEQKIQQKSGHSESVGLEDLSIFMELLDAAEIGEILQGDLNGMTIFVPTNQAFQTLFLALELSYEEMIEDKIALKDILLYHVVPEHISTEQLADKLVLPTFLENRMLVVAHQYKTNITNITGIGSTAKLATQAINLGEGIIHVLDTVLLPFIPPQEVDRRNFPQFIGYQQESGHDSQPGFFERMMSSIQSLLR
eukprot:TRINITY_DN1052_c0_g1_i2.p1 TRINITY_DN1052_c0_g1~~TRINITY_DN1052_c0_g1_i2.p1  ORF type:complete len:696 (-),score=76.76 TRINITY_DN1052_c0_g1_i2:773-2860(-)